MLRSQHYKNRYRVQLLARIERLDGQVFAREDLTSDHSNREQLRLNRALKTFIDDGLITKISHGLYAKAMTMTFFHSKQRVVLRDSFESVAMEALDKLELKWELGEAIQAYNRGETTQIPVVFSVKLQTRFRGTISAEGRRVIFEGDVNAR
jgi:hypothetical protein